MQFLDIYQEDELFLRIPLGETDLMEISGNWFKDIETRKRTVEFMVSQLMENSAMVWLRLIIEKPEYYLVFESKMNLLASEGATIEHPCDAPFISSITIERGHCKDFYI